MLASTLSSFSPKSTYVRSTLREPSSCSPGCRVRAGWQMHGLPAEQFQERHVADCYETVRDQTPHCLFHRRKNGPRKFAQGYLY